MPQSIQDRYLDLDISFRKNPKTDDIYELKDIEAVKRAVKLLVMTKFNEIQFHPEIGSSLYSSLFENVTFDTKLIIERSIREVINNYEPRARILKVDTNLDPDNNLLEVTITFFVVNIEDPVSITINLERVR